MEVLQPRLSGTRIFNPSFVTRVVLAHERRLHTENWRGEIKTPPKSGRFVPKTNNNNCVFRKEVNPYLSIAKRMNTLSYNFGTNPDYGGGSQPMVPPSTVNPYSYANPIPVDSTASMMSSSTSPVSSVYAMPSASSYSAAVTNPLPVYNPASMPESQPGVSSYSPIPVSIPDTTAASMSSPQPYSDVKPTVVDMSVNPTTAAPTTSNPSTFAATPNTVTVPVESFPPAAPATVSISTPYYGTMQAAGAPTTMNNPSSSESVVNPQK